MLWRFGKSCVCLLWTLPFLFSFLSLSAKNADAGTARSFCKTYPGDKAIEWECRRMGKGETLEKLFGERWQDVARFNRIDRRHAHAGVYLKFPKRPADLRDYTPMPRRFGPAEEEEKFILVDLSKQFLGAYERGRLVFSTPIASGKKTNKTPAGKFRVSAFNRRHESSAYFIKDSDIPYPMHYGLRFHIDGEGVSYWLHGRDMPGYPASHGCVGLYDEEMQREFYGFPRKPELADARKLFEWALSPLTDDGKFHVEENGPKVWVVERVDLPRKTKLVQNKVIDLF